MITRRAVTMARAGQVTAADGTTLTLQVRSLCLHGDTPAR